ncbi:hypothetical protein BCR42DRAFT_397450 [Absidia repens]|uniref:F-box domain-containing protein n=1 Tax=Absidia repens TaxID=90262 RepID=A0A1X2I161_9FUNG|nr:hypothetical protein BCR42DRAFT_397450 [Absidia repens]
MFKLTKMGNTGLYSLCNHIEQKQDLFACSLVNQWFYTCTLPFLWHFHEEHYRDSPTALINCLAEARHPMTTYMRKLVLREDWTKDHILRLVPHLHRLEDLTLYCDDVLGDTIIQQLPHYCPNLKALVLIASPITLPTIHILAQHYHHQLYKLHLHDCVHLPSRAFTPLIEHGGGDVIRDILFSNQADGPFWTTLAVDDVLAGFPKVTHFECNDDTPEVIEHLLMSLADLKAWPELTHLTLDGLELCDDIDRYLIPCIQTHPHLTHLQLHRADFTDATLDALACFLPSLMYLRMDWNHTVTVDGIRRLVHQCRTLTLVELYSCLLPAIAFPEITTTATNECLEFDTDDNYYLVRYLDQKTINAMRQNPYKEPQSRGIDNDDLDWLLSWERSFTLW